MVKNTKGGNKSKSQARKNQQEHSVKLENVIKDDEQEYARIDKINGGGRYQLSCTDGIARLGIARGKINRHGKINIGSLVLISKRDYQDGKCDILHFYNHDEIRLLVSHNEIHEKFINIIQTQEDNIEFSNNIEDNKDEEINVAFEDL